jgi:hypothetical protein
MSKPVARRASYTVAPRGNATVAVPLTGSPTAELDTDTDTVMFEAGAAGSGSWTGADGAAEGTLPESTEEADGADPSAEEAEDDPPLSAAAFDAWSCEVPAAEPATEDVDPADAADASTSEPSPPSLGLSAWDDGCEEALDAVWPSIVDWMPQQTVATAIRQHATIAAATLFRRARRRGCICEASIAGEMRMSRSG